MSTTLNSLILPAYYFKFDQKHPSKASYKLYINSNSTAAGSTSKDIKLDDTQMSYAPLTTSYVIKSQRQKPKQYTPFNSVNSIPVVIYYCVFISILKIYWNDNKMIDDQSIVGDQKMSSKHGIAVAIYFAPMKQQPEIALTEMELCNNADVPLLFKLRSDTISSVTAAPAGSGCIPPRAEQRCFLTWRRPVHQEEKHQQEDTKVPKLILITNFVEQEIDNNQTVETKLIARMHSDGKRSDDQIPLMKFTFEKKEVISPSETLSSIAANFRMIQIDKLYGHCPLQTTDKKGTYPGRSAKRAKPFDSMVSTPSLGDYDNTNSIDIMEEEISVAVPSSSSSNPSDANDSKVSYLSNVERNITILFGILPRSTQVTSSSFGSIITDCSKICRYCLSDDDISEWLTPCKCIGTMKNSLMLSSVVIVMSLVNILVIVTYPEILIPISVSYVYRRQWKLKPYKNWHWPQFHLRVIDLFEIYFDITLTYRICHYFPRCLDNRVTFFLYASYVLLWKYNKMHFR
ncbi:unnamed protein product [Onchocerca ochengi]|uniref:C2 domain-containing protein n=1 Tax=Onchocerca ochengi TaxID=42157 RepID=A0A182DYU0_ONCOC|nr:unnamed protein product [Onchocerca ochengi]